LTSTVGKIHTMEVNAYQHSSKYLILRSTKERNAYGFGTTQGCVNNELSL